MGDTTDNQAVRAALDAVVARHGLVVEDLVVRPGKVRGLVRVVVDLPDDQLGGVDSEVLGEASRDISAALDVTDPMPGQYTLEVTTPGVSRPLTEVRHWKRARGHLVQVPVAGEGELLARVEDADDNRVLLRAQGAGQVRELTYDVLGPGIVQVELSRPAGKG